MTSSPTGDLVRRIGIKSQFRQPATNESLLQPRKGTRMKMFSKHAALILAVATAATLTSCGKEEKADMGGQSATTDQPPANSGQGSAPMTLVLTAAEMPPCGAENNNQLIYVKDSAKFMTCSNGAWADIAIKGEKGDAGAKGDAGEKGDKGDQGQAGIGMEVANVYQCPIGSDIGVDDYRYGGFGQITKYSDGSYLFSCSAYKFPIDDSFIDSSSFTVHWPASSNGVTSGMISCIPLHITSYFSISAKTLTFENQADDTRTETVACTEVFPGN